MPCESTNQNLRTHIDPWGPWPVLNLLKLNQLIREFKSCFLLCFLLFQYCGGVLLCRFLIIVLSFGLCIGLPLRKALTNIASFSLWLSVTVQRVCGCKQCDGVLKANNNPSFSYAPSFKRTTLPKVMKRNGEILYIVPTQIITSILNLKKVTIKK